MPRPTMTGAAARGARLTNRSTTTSIANLLWFLTQTSLSIRTVIAAFVEKGAFPGPNRACARLLWLRPLQPIVDDLASWGSLPLEPAQRGKEQRDDAGV